MMDFNALIPELAKGGLAVVILGGIAWLLWQAFTDGNTSRITELKENNKLMADLAKENSAAMLANAQATEKQTDVMRTLDARLSNIETILRGK